MGASTRAAIVTGLMALLGAVSASAAPASGLSGQWLNVPSAAAISEPAPSLLAPAVAMNASGAEVVAWVQGQALMASVRQPGGGAFAAPVTLNPDHAPAGYPTSPKVAIDVAGNVLVAWGESDGGSSYSLQLATAGPGQVPTAGTTVPGTTGTEYIVGLATGFLDDGTALVVWARNGGAIELMARPPGGSFSVPASLANSDVEEATLAPESGDRALLAWRETKDEEIGSFIVAVSRIKTADLSAAGTASAVQTIGTYYGNVLGLSSAANRAGDAVVSFVEWGEESFFTTSVAKVAYRASGGAFEVPAVSMPKVTSFGYANADSGMLADGTALVAWDEGFAGMGAIQYEQRSREGSFPATAQTLVAGGGAAMNIAPRMVSLGEAAWVAYSDGARILAQLLSGAGPQGTPVTLSTGTSASQQALSGDGEGDAVAVWESKDAEEAYAVMGAAYDAGPRLSGLAVPASGLTGVALPFAATAVDPLSPLSVKWTFGDGAQAEGANVSHAYATPGAQMASVVATDAAGMVSDTLSGVTQIAPAPSPGPGTGNGTGTGTTGHGVHPGGGPARRATLKIPKQRLREVLRKGLAVTISCREACKLTLTLQVAAGAAAKLGLIARHPTRAPVSIGRLGFKLTAAGRRTVHVKLTKTAKRRLAHARKLTLSVIETPSAPGTQKRFTQQVTLR